MIQITDKEGNKVSLDYEEIVALKALIKTPTNPIDWSIIPDWYDCLVVGAQLGKADFCRETEELFQTADGNDWSVSYEKTERLKVYRRPKPPGEKF